MNETSAYVTGHLISPKTLLQRKPGHFVNIHYQQQKLNFNRNRLNLSDKSKSVSNLHVNLSIWIDFE